MVHHDALSTAVTNANQHPNLFELQVHVTVHPTVILFDRFAPSGNRIVQGDKTALFGVRNNSRRRLWMQTPLLQEPPVRERERVREKHGVASLVTTKFRRFVQARRVTDSDNNTCSIQRPVSLVDGRNLTLLYRYIAEVVRRRSGCHLSLVAVNLATPAQSKTRGVRFPL